jgi:hypothetical protein
VTIRIEDLEEEAVEVNRRYNNYEALRLQHRERVMGLFGETEDPKELKGLARILMMTKGGE